MGWKVVLQTRETIAHKDFNSAYYDSGMMFLQNIRKYTKPKIITTGFWWWKKTREIQVSMQDKTTLLIIPLHEIRYIYSGSEYVGHEFIEGGTDGGEQKHEKREEKQAVGDTSLGDTTDGKPGNT